LRIVDGLIHQTIKQVNTVAYAFTNTDDRDRTILVEHPKQNGWDLVEPEEPYEQTDDLYRFEVAVDAGRDAALTVRQERTHVQTVAVASFDLPTLLAYSRQGKASPEVVEAVRTAAAMQAAINDLERRIGRLDEERKAIDADQSRIRQNMSTVS